MARKDIDPHEETKAESIRPGKMIAGLPIGGYELISVLGEGGMGVVWSAHDPNLDRTLAIKVLKRSDAAPALRKRLLREARAMARLKHPNVLTVYEVGTEGDRDFIAMELVEGGSLDEWLDRHPPRDDVMKAVLAAGRGLAAAHAAGLVHRDFKPHNILRSRDGRVLVTDFGLARGMGEDSQPGTASDPDISIPPEAALDVTIRPTQSANRTDSVLDSPLTHTGALIGTPAYMAPEQFLGGAPDPRTDQFAFCVTAWQALTGLRPYTGASLDELRKNASAGVSPSMKVDLPPAVRAALVRGLSPDPEKRWPSLDDLLEALEDAVKPRRPAWVVPVAALAVVGLVTGTVLIARRGGDKSSSSSEIAGCGSNEDPFAEAWSPAIRDEIAKDFRTRSVDVSNEMFARIADPLDAFRERWIKDLSVACSTNTKLAQRQRDCLFGIRDEVSTLAYVVRMGSAARFAGFDVHGVLPNLGACSGPTPGAPPLFPEDPRQRVRVIAATANALALRDRPDLAAAAAQLERDAAEIGWPPLGARMQSAVGLEMIRRRDMAGRALLAKAAEDATAVHDMRISAASRLGLLEASLAELADPGMKSKEGELHAEIDRLLTFARADIKAAGSDPILVGAIQFLEARAYLGLAQWGRHAKAYETAASLAAKAKQSFVDAGDLRRAAGTTALIATIMLESKGDLEDATFVTRSAGEALIAAKLEPSPALDESRAAIALARGDYAAAAALYGQTRTPPPTGAAITGTVVDTEGKPLKNARVVVWRGAIEGDPANIVSDPRGLEGDRAETGADGGFTVHAVEGDAIMAELVGRRSVPARVGKTAPKLVLEPTTELTGTIDQVGLVDVWATARFAVGPHSWELRVPFTKDGAFHLMNLPRSAAWIGAVGAAGHATRRVRAPSGQAKWTWPVGEGVEVIARGGVEPGAMAWVFSNNVLPRTRGEAEALAASAPDVAIARLVPVGADNTDGGRGYYEPGDKHAVLLGNAPGMISVCVTRGSAASSTVECERRETEPLQPGLGFDVYPRVFTDGGRGTPAP